MTAAMTRRMFLAAMAAGAARAASGSKILHLAAINDEIGETREDSIAFARQYGIQWLEMRAAQIPGKQRYCETLSLAEARELRKQLSGHGIRVSVLDSSLLKCQMPGTVAVDREEFYTRYFAELGLSDEALYKGRIDIMKRTIDVAHALDTPNIRVFGFWRVKDPAPILPQVADAMGELAETAHKENCRLLIENEGSTNVATSTESVEILKRVQSPGLGLNWDPQNAVGLEPAQFPEAYQRLPKNRIGNVHVKAEGLFGPKHPLDWGAIMQAMLRDGYTGHFSLETHRGRGARNVAASHESMEKMIRLVNAA